MSPLPFVVLWSAWIIYWAASARAVKPAERTETRASRLSHSLPVAAAFILHGLPPYPGAVLSLRLVPGGWPTFVIGLAMTVLGLGFTVWARVHLGTNWSATITQKRDHELVRSGPYAWVRHPIYTGLLLAFFGGLVAKGALSTALSCALVVFALVRKSRIEERWMRERFGDAYDQYRAEVPALVPWPRAKQRGAVLR